ncbi:hypothetical protein FHW37_108151 [Neorhizobium alkalisoli]|uniref:Uncharacterized protein n=1 Tax=Neorhizobium alkalisoli TaxID=528178 RepID=A0A561QGQ8_9HYPH|nr:hypothetical protein FHW37_108151 [Neorhizobium alkalisoli]
MMGERVIWTSLRARNQFDHLLDEAKDKGPQDIRDVRGTFTLIFKPEAASTSVTEFLAKGLPES